MTLNRPKRRVLWILAGLAVATTVVGLALRSRASSDDRAGSDDRGGATSSPVRAGASLPNSQPPRPTVVLPDGVRPKPVDNPTRLATTVPPPPERPVPPPQR